MRRWLCTDCSRETSHPTVRVYRYRGVQPDETVYCCPSCGGDELEELQQCDNIVRGRLCDGWCLPDKPLCKSCWNDLCARFRMFYESLTGEEEEVVGNLVDGVPIEEWGKLFETV